MGRWSQQRRRGGGGGAPPPPPVLPSLTAAQDFGGGDILLTFDAPITANPAAVPDATSLELDTNPTTVTFADNVSANQLQVTQSTSPSAGMTAAWALQPPWITTLINIGSSAVVT